jgi:hypothetical protein
VFIFGGIMTEFEKELYKYLDDPSSDNSFCYNTDPSCWLKVGDNDLYVKMTLRTWDNSYKPLEMTVRYYDGKGSKPRGHELNVLPHLGLFGTLKVHRKIRNKFRRYQEEQDKATKEFVNNILNGKT